MQTLQRAGVALLVLTVVGGLVACGDDDDSASTDTTEAPGNEGGAAVGENAKFCDAVVAFNTAAFEVDLSEESTKDDVIATGETLSPLSQKLVDEAPEDLVPAAEEIDGFVSPMLEGDAEAFNADATFETYMGFLGKATAACDFAEVKVEARDYAYTAPDTIKAGTVSIAFTNTSEGEDHEMSILQKADGVDLTWEELLALPEEEAMSKTKFITAAYAGPGDSGSTLATLKPGKYAMACFIPLGGAEDGAPHFTEGMIHEFTVE